ncbi:MAG: hypothetical protein QG608_3187 [Actinomycetota bacterium]|nr:hypothetical protein [Actinomycetota bacterium]
MNRRPVPLTASAAFVLAVLGPLPASAVPADVGREPTRATTHLDEARPPCAEPRRDKYSCLLRIRPASQARAAGTPVPSPPNRKTSWALSSTAPDIPVPDIPVPQAGYGPADIRNIYGLPLAPDTRQTIAVVVAGDAPSAETDLAVYREFWGLPPCTTENGCFTKIDQRGGNDLPMADPGWAVEAGMDVQAVSATCPSCKILLVEADSADFFDMPAAVDQAVAHGADIVSNSWGAAETGAFVSAGPTSFTHPGVPILAASGDSGFSYANFPASWSKVIAVGGTTVTRSTEGWEHFAWAGSGSGCSTWVDKPHWQHDENCSLRTTSDVSALADPQTGLAFYQTYGPSEFGLDPGWFVGGGTSLAAPLVAGMIALSGLASSMDDASGLYEHSQELLDVVTGTNGECGDDYLCTARPGYDAPTGTGTPRGPIGW